MTDFSPLDSALYESTPEEIAASLRYLRKADAVMAALMPLSASTQAPPAAVPDGMVMVQRADLAALEATDFGRCGWSARADLAARRLRAAMLAANKENNNG